MLHFQRSDFLIQFSSGKAGIAFLTSTSQQASYLELRVQYQFPHHQIYKLHMYVCLTHLCIPSIYHVLEVFQVLSIAQRKNNRTCIKNGFLSIFYLTIFYGYLSISVNLGPVSILVVHCMYFSSHIIVIFSFPVYFPNQTMIFFNTGTRLLSLQLQGLACNRNSINITEQMNEKNLQPQQ